MEIMMDHARREPVPPGRLVPVPAELDALVLSLLAKDPEQRPPNARSVIHALDAVPLPPGGQWGEAQQEAWWSKFTGREPLSEVPRKLEISRPVGVTPAQD